MQQSTDGGNVRPDVTWTVHRQDDNGNRFAFETGLSRQEAEQRVAMYERLGHKQTYWAEANER